jgi:aryl-alcohol dehydrogenase-like predicted oxidoreductase/ferredoxin
MLVSHATGIQTDVDADRKQKEDAMQTLRLGRTELVVGKVAVGALPIQRVPQDEAVRILHRAVAGGVTFFDTARSYSNSEEKLGAAFAGGMRKKLVIASKTQAGSPEGIRRDIATSLAALRTDYIDIYQFHNPKTVPLPDDGTGRYETFLDLKKAGAVRFISLTNHSLEKARQAVASGLYDTVQFPFSMLSTDQETQLAHQARDADVGFLGMKGLGGGLIRNVAATFAYTRRFDNVLPLWGIQRMEELEEFLALDAAPPVWDSRMEHAVTEEKNALGPSFCRGCGYCLPCPAGIEIPTVARLTLLLGRSPWQRFVTPEWREKIAATAQCTHCNACKSRCPYHLDTPALVADNAQQYALFLQKNSL